MSDDVTTDSDAGRPAENGLLSRLSFMDNTEVSTVDNTEVSTVDNTEVSTVDNTETFEQAVIGRLDHLILLVNDARNGIGATYAGTSQVLQLLAGVQQVAAMMPGKIGKTVREMASNMNGVQP